MITYSIVLAEKSNDKTTTLAKGLSREEALAQISQHIQQAKDAPSECTTLSAQSEDTRALQEMVMADTDFLPEVIARFDFEFREQI